MRFFYESQSILIKLSISYSSCFQNNFSHGFIEQVLPLSLKNEGTLMSRVNIDLKDPCDVYSISCVGGTKALMPLDEGEDEGDPKSRVHTLSVVVPMGKTADFSIELNPSLVRRTVGEIRLTVVDNPYEESIVQLIGEGYQDEVTIDNIRSYVQTEHQAAEVEIDDETPGNFDISTRFCEYTRSLHNLPAYFDISAP